MYFNALCIVVVLKKKQYIKDEDKWEIEKNDRLKLKHALKRISNKSVNCLHDVAHTENFEQTCIKNIERANRR